MLYMRNRLSLAVKITLALAVMFGIMAAGIAVGIWLRDHYGWTVSLLFVLFFTVLFNIGLWDVVHSRLRR